MVQASDSNQRPPSEPDALPGLSHAQINFPSLPHAPFSIRDADGNPAAPSSSYVLRRVTSMDCYRNENLELTPPRRGVIGSEKPRVLELSPST